MNRLMLLGLFSLGLFAVTFTPSKAADEKTIKLFNGKDMTNFYTFLKGEGKNSDSKHVFTIVKEDGAPAIRVSGEVWGCFTTEKSFENYKLIVEFKWGKKTYAPRLKAARDSGILVHCVGQDGAAGGAWMESIECQMIEGGTGDLIPVAAPKSKNPPKVTAEIEEKPTGVGEKKHMENYYKPGAPKKTVSGRVNWYDRSPVWADKLDFRGDHDIEKPIGEWNTVEVICDGKTMTNIVNGKVAAKGTDVFPSSGKILFQSEGAEVFFRRIDLVPLK